MQDTPLFFLLLPEILSSTISRAPLAPKKLYKRNIARTSVVSSTNFGSILIFASCVVGTCNILYRQTKGEFLLGGILFVLQIYID